MIQFFDRDKDGIIFPWETFEGFRAVGFNPILSAFAVPVIHSVCCFTVNDQVSGGAVYLSGLFMLFI